MFSARYGIKFLWINTFHIEFVKEIKTRQISKNLSGLQLYFYNQLQNNWIERLPSLIIIVY